MLWLGFVESLWQLDDVIKCMHTYIHAYIHTYIYRYTSIQAWMPNLHILPNLPNLPSLPAYLAYLHTFTHSFDHRVIFRLCRLQSHRVKRNAHLVIHTTVLVDCSSAVLISYFYLSARYGKHRHLAWFHFSSSPILTSTLHLLLDIREPSETQSGF